MAAEGSAESAHAGGVHDFGAAGDGGDGHATTQGFRHGDQIRLDAEMFGGEPFASAGEAGLHFVGDEEDAVLAADSLQQLEIIARGNDEAAFTENGFGDHGGDGFGRDGTVEGVFETDNGGALSVGAGDFDGVFDGFGPGVEEDGFFREIAGGEGVEFFGDGDVAFVGSDGEAEMQVLLELRADGGEYARRAMADVEATDAPGEIEIAIAVDVLDGGAFGARGEDGRGVRRAAGNGGFAAGHQGAGLGARYFGANLNGVHGFRFSISSEKQIPRSA